jgi:hypothetical protein
MIDPNTPKYVCGRLPSILIREDESKNEKNLIALIIHAYALSLLSY